jgi:hypothetical protein
MCLTSIPSIYPKMTSIRGLNTSLIQVSSNLTYTNNTLKSNFWNLRFNQNLTGSHLNVAFGDSSTPILESFTTYHLLSLFAFITLSSLAIFIVYLIQQKEMLTPNQITTWIKNKYINYNKTEVLPLYRPKKAKESPFVSSMPMPQILPKCPNLEGAERGQNNIMFRVSVPYRRFQSSDNLPAEAEHRITITTTVEQSEQGADKK